MEKAAAAADCFPRFRDSLVADFFIAIPACSAVFPTSALPSAPFNGALRAGHRRGSRVGQSERTHALYADSWRATPRAFRTGSERSLSSSTAMAEHLASIYGTEKDRVNRPFYFKIGACRHGERCSRLHMRPTLSQTILMTNMYENPEYAAATGAIPAMTKAQCQDHFEDFYEDVFEECA